MTAKAERMTRLYLLLDPVTREPRYVGKTVLSLANRLSGHMSEARRRKGGNLRVNWIRSLIAKGLVPLIEQVEEAGADWAERERALIAQYRDAGARLTNICDGGEGASGATRSPEWRRNLSKRTAARMQALAATPEGRAGLASKFTATISDPEWKAWQSARVKEWSARPEVMDAKAAFWNGENRARHANLTATQWTDERRAAQSKKARNPSDETRARIAAAAKAGWIKRRAATSSEAAA